MSQKSETYRYQKNTLVSKVVSSSSKQNERTTTNSFSAPKNDEQIPRCNKCGKYKVGRTKKITTYETATFTKKTQIDQKKERNTYSKTTTVPKRSSNLKGDLDLTPKVKVKLDPEKIRKAVEEQKRIAEEEKKKRAQRTYNAKENTKKYNEQKYTYKIKKEREIKDDDICHCGDENCQENKKKEVKKVEVKKVEVKEIKKKVVQPIKFEDVPIKTFYHGYIQKRYTVAEGPFPERNSYTINIISNMVNTSSEMNANCGNTLCPGCGRMTLCQKNEMTQRIQNTKIELNEENAMEQKEECICPNCQKAVIQKA